MLKMADSAGTKIPQLGSEPSHTAAIRFKQTILAPFVAAGSIIFEAAHPPHVWFYYLRNYMRLLGLWPAQARAVDRFYYACNMFIMLLVGVFVCTITCDLYDAASDIVLFGEDLVVALGVSTSTAALHFAINNCQLYLILFKIWLFRYRRCDIDAIIAEFDALHTRYAQHREMLRHRRVFFLGEFSAFVAFVALALLLFAAMSAQPLLSSHPLLPFRAKFPIQLDDPVRHPHCFLAIYVFQCCCLMYMLLAIVIMDNLGGNAFSQMTVNLKVLCVRIRELGRGANGGAQCVPSAEMWQQLCDIVEFHQQLISLNGRINEIYYWNYVSQMGASTFMICLTAFEALLAQDQPMVAMKFRMYMFSAFMQLFYWCWMGNMTHFESMGVATAALEMHAWYEQSPRFQRNLMFLIQRAQKPLEFRARPFYAFNFESFTSILSTSYSYFALLRTMND